MLHGLASDGGTWEEQGPEGTYSTVYVPPLGMFEDINPLVRAALAVATGGVSEGFMAASKGLMGETLHLSDYAAMAGLAGIT